MSDKAETIELFLLDERGIFVASLYPTVTSAPEFVKFENRHYRRIGKLRDSPEQWQYEHTRTVNASNNCVVFVGDGSPVWRYLGTLPSTPDPVTDETLPSQVPTITVTHNGAATPPFPERYIKPAMGLGASGIENVTCGACGRPDRVLTAALTERDAAIAEQAAEIERLKKNYEDAAGAFVIARESSATRHLAAQQMIAEQNELRLEVEKLKDLNYEAQDRYAAIEAERDELNARVERLTNYRLEATAKAESERDEARHDLAEASARAEKYLAVIKAKDLELFYTVSAHSAALKACVAMAEAGLPLHVIEETE